MQSMVSSLNDLIGIPYQTHGRDESGIDCLGLVILFYRKHGINLPDYLDLYQDTRNFELLNQHIDDNKGKFERVSAPRFGDIVLMRIGRFACHLGIYINESTFLHAHDGRESAIDRTDSYVWRERIVGYYRACDIQRQSV